MGLSRKKIERPLFDILKCEKLIGAGIKSDIWTEESEKTN